MLKYDPEHSAYVEKIWDALEKDHREGKTLYVSSLITSIERAWDSSLILNRNLPIVDDMVTINNFAKDIKCLLKILKSEDYNKLANRINDIVLTTFVNKILPALKEFIANSDDNKAIEYDLQQVRDAWYELQNDIQSQYKAANLVRKVHRLYDHVVELCAKSQQRRYVLGRSGGLSSWWENASVLEMIICAIIIYIAISIITMLMFGKQLIYLVIN